MTCFVIVLLVVGVLGPFIWIWFFNNDCEGDV